MTKKINISIPQPCHENWEAMTVVEKGKFCSSCQKKVYDFTKASDKEIIDILNNENTTCGRFSISQLNRNLYTNQQKSSYWLIASASVLGFLGLGNHSSYAQVKNDIVQVGSKDVKIDNDSINPNLPHKIRGTVYIENEILSGAKVYLKGKQNEIFTDFDGNFEILDARLGDIIIVYYMGNENYEEIVSTKQVYNIYIEDKSIYEVYAVGGICVRKTFFGRQIQKVKNWFR